MRTIFSVLTGIAICTLSGSWALNTAVERIAPRLPPFNFSGLQPQLNGVDLTDLTVLHRGRIARADRLAVRWRGPLGWRVFASTVRLEAGRNVVLRDVFARQAGADWQFTGRAMFDEHTVAMRGTVNPSERSASVEGQGDWLFRGRVRGVDLQVQRAHWAADTLTLTGVDAMRKTARWQGGTVRIERAPCGWQPDLSGGHVWYSKQRSDEAGPLEAPVASTSSPALACPIHAQQIDAQFATPLGVRTVHLVEADFRANSLLARGETTGAEGEVLLPLSGAWAAGTGRVDLGVVAELLGRTEVGGDALGSGWILRDGEHTHAGLDGRLHATLVHPAIAEAPVVIRDLSVQAALTHGPEGIRVQIPRMEKGGVHAQAILEWTKDTVDARLALAQTSCQALWDAIPDALRGPYRNARLSRQIAPNVRLRVPRANPMKLTLDWTGPSECDVDGLHADPAQLPPALVDGERDDVDWLTRPFRFPVQYATKPIEVGPGTSSWVPLDQLPRWVGTAAIVSEDNAFNRGHALNLNLLRRALMFNLDRGRYVYGGSTIPQQLVKNLFLTRRKTLARKLQEAVVAMRMVDVLSTRQVLELYLNCIEFAPNVYGIERAARHYFQKGARQLTPKEAAFLAIAKPAPKYAAAMRRRGATPATAHFKEYMRRIVARMRKRGAISAAQAAAARPFAFRWRAGRIISEAQIAPQDAHL